MYFIVITLPSYIVDTTSTLPWARMLSDMFDHLQTKSFGLWETNHWDAVLGKLDGYIKGCPFSSKLLKHWKDVLHHIKWRGRNSKSRNSLRLEGLHWSIIFPCSQAKQESRKVAYFLEKTMS